MPVALLALAISCFCIGTTEFAIVGLLPQVAADLSVSIPDAGLLVSGYALAVVVGAPLLSAASTWLPRKTVLVALLVVFLVGNLLCATAPSYELLLVGRMVTALTQGAFHGVGVVVATDMVDPSKRGRAIALMFTGFTVSNVVGVPLATALGQANGWRSAFWAIAGCGVVALVAVTALVSHRSRMPQRGLRRDLAVFRRPQVWLGLATTAVGFGGVFATFTYIAPLLTNVASFPAHSVSLLLVIVGAGLILGNLLGGWFADRALVPSVVVSLAVLSAVSVLFVFAIRSPVATVVTLFCFGVAALGTVAPLQAQVLAWAEDAPVLASAANISAFNLANATGAYLGGLVIGAGLGYSATNWVGALLALGGVCIAAAAGLRRRTRTGATR